jgi:hypothetical protein
MSVFKYLGGMGVGIVASAFLFQTLVLYPWHSQITEELFTLKNEVVTLQQKMIHLEQQKILLLRCLADQVTKDPPVKKKK